MVLGNRGKRGKKKDEKSPHVTIGGRKVLRERPKPIKRPNHIPEKKIRKKNLTKEDKIIRQYQHGLSDNPEKVVEVEKGFARASKSRGEGEITVRCKWCDEVYNKDKNNPEGRCPHCGEVTAYWAPNRRGYR